MAITRYRDRNWNPWQDLDDVTNRLTRLFGDQTLGETGTAAWMPAVNVEETGEEVILTAELPGMRQEDVDIELENNVLTIRGRKDLVREEGEDRRYHVWERRFGSFQRAFTLPRTVDADSISATFQDGVLHVNMPKAAEAKGRKIEIRSESA